MRKNWALFYGHRMRKGRQKKHGTPEEVPCIKQNRLNNTQELATEVSGELKSPIRWSLIALLIDTARRCAHFENALISDVVTKDRHPPIALRRCIGPAEANLGPRRLVTLRWRSTPVRYTIVDIIRMIGIDSRCKRSAVA